MRIQKSQFFLGALAILLFASGSLGQQQRIFDWVAANDETVRLDPANYHSGPIYRPGPDGGNNHVDIKAQLPVTIFMTPEETWQQALQHPETIANLPQTCPREHVVETTYVCHVPPQAMRLVIRDERYSPENAVFAGLGEVMEPIKRANAVGQEIAAVFNAERRIEQTSTRRFKEPNDVHIQYYNWNCVQNCVQPEFRWMEQVREKYQLTSFLKVYGGFQPDHNGEQVSIKIKSPVPMVVAMLPSQIANELHAQPGTLETALQKNACQQRGVQSLQFECTFNLADGPQSLVVAPEEGERVPHKKAEILMLAWRCVENCQLLQTAKQ